MSAGNNRLAVLAAAIRAAHCDVASAGQVAAERSLAAGRALIEAKSSVPHGGWAAWCRDHAGLNPRTARFYMQIARSGLETATVADLGLRGAVEMLATMKPPRPGHWLHAITIAKDRVIVWPAINGGFNFYILDGICGSGATTNKRPVPEEILFHSLIVAGFPSETRFEHLEMSDTQAALFEQLRAAVRQ
jgi:hypothetical protein